LENVAFWGPRGYGDTELYDASIRIIDNQKKVLDKKKQKLGIRTAEVIYTDITTPVNPGEFAFKINGEKIFVKGTDWVPLDAFHSRDKSHLAEAMKILVVSSN
jgi:beta-mannosidase